MDINKKYSIKLSASIIFILISFKSFVQADDVSEFTIEEMSVGDSLLNHYNKKEIQSFKENSSYYRDKLFSVIFVDRNSDLYDRIQVTLKKDDKNVQIFSLEGIIDFDKNIDDCNNMRKKIIKDIKKMFSDYERIDDDGIYQADKSNNSFSYTTWFLFNSGGFISVECTKMGNEVREANGWTDELAISITSEEFENFLRQDNPY